MDNDTNTCVTIPRNNKVDPMVEMRLNLTRVATQNAQFNMAEPLVTLKVTTQGMTSCENEGYLLVEKLNGCERVTVRSCNLVVDNLGSDNSCEYSCECGNVQNDCSMYIIQGSSYLNETISLCNVA